MGKSLPLPAPPETEGGGGGRVRRRRSSTKDSDRPWSLPAAQLFFLPGPPLARSIFHGDKGSGYQHRSKPEGAACACHQL